MKTLKSTSGELKRVSDQEAMNLVGRTWSYVAKKEWKEFKRGIPEPVVEKVVTAVTAEADAVKQKKKQKNYDKRRDGKS